MRNDAPKGTLCSRTFKNEPVQATEVHKLHGHVWLIRADVVDAETVICHYGRLASRSVRPC